jgi:hypothetical protein
MLRRAEHRAWCLRHGKTLPPPRLHPVILKVIREWFDLVDDDGSGTLEHHELLAALQVGTCLQEHPALHKQRCWPMQLPICGQHSKLRW